ncbi:MAG: MotA/TolQ/ExbB proton channel family protein [Planctomycetaceae bacterium]
MDTILEASGPVIYTAMALAALYGVFCAILMVRKIAQKRMSPGMASEFLDETRELLQKKDFDGVAELCDSPPWWSKAVPQLVLYGIANRSIGPSKLKLMLAEKFERDVLADLEYQGAWITTIVKTAPMLGLLGTVTGMILAFAKIATAAASGGVNPADLASDISFALFTTAAGLAIAIPLTVLGSWVQVRIGKLTDAVQEQTTEFMSDLESAMRS